MDIFLVLYEAKHLSLATHRSCVFVIFSGSFLIPLSLLKGPGLVVVVGVFLARSLKILGLNYPGLQAKLWKYILSTYRKYFHSLKNSIHAPLKQAQAVPGLRSTDPVPASLGPIKMSLFLGSEQRKAGWLDQRQLRTPLPQQDSKPGGGAEPQVRSCQSLRSARAARFPAPSGGAGHARAVDGAGWGEDSGRWLGC